MKSISWFIIGSFGLIFILLPNSSPFIEIPYNSKRIFQVGFLFLMAFQIGLSKKYFTHFRVEWEAIPKKLKFIIYIIGTLGFISALQAEFSFYAFVEICVFILLLVLVFLLLNWYKQNPDLFLKTIGVILSLMVVLYFIRFSVNYIYNFVYPDWPVWPSIKFTQMLVHGKPLFPEPFLGFVNQRFLNHLHTWSLPLFALFIIKIPKQLWAYRTLLYFFTSFWWMLVFASDARGTMLASLLSLILVAALFRERIKQWTMAYLITFVLGLLSYLFFFKFLLPEGSRTVLTRFDDSSRITLWNNVLELFKENPLLGAGPMHFADISNGFAFAHPHNFYLQILSEWGIISFLLLAGLFIYLFSKWFIKSYESELEGNVLLVQTALTASLSAGFMHSFVSGLFHTPLSQLMAAIVIAWSIGFYQLHFKNNPVNKTLDVKKLILKSRISRAFLISVAMFVLIATYKSYKDLPESREKYILQENTARFSPRFWDHGNIGLD
ncbi:O-antigen ligase family protein [Gracilimonas sp. Q87]|uniref:O-antigen ligase family protein n=1 Tax=Gracilimonas sp. Q87 TaxID=3384766 RepID=UPI003984568A